MQDIVKILRIIGNEVRMQIIKLLYNEGELSYGELMQKIGIARDKSGKFGYHLRQLIDNRIIEIDRNTGKYRLTDLGFKIFDLFKEFRESYLALQSRDMLVSTSKYVMEYFDKNKIIDSLVRETGIKKSLAKEVAVDVEEKLKNANLRYVSTNLIRELVIATLLEKGCEEYIKKYSRYGLPVYDVKNIFESYDLVRPYTPNVLLRILGRSIIEAYTMSQLIPPSALVAHLNGYIHIANSSDWFIGVEDIRHDLCLCLSKENFMGNKFFPEIIIPAPKNFREALFSMYITLNYFKDYYCISQIIENFNFILSPFISKGDQGKVSLELLYFTKMLNINNLSYRNYRPIALACAFSLPKEYEDIKIKYKNTGLFSFVDYMDEALLLAKTLLNVLANINSKYPSKTPIVVLKVNDRVLRDDDLLSTIYKALTSRVPITLVKEENYVSTSSEGIQLEKPKEIPILPAYGIISSIAVNLPLIMLESHTEEKFFDKIYNVADSVALAFNSKHSFIKDIVAKRRLKPLTEYILKGDYYYRWEYSRYLISFIGVYFTAFLLAGNDNKDHIISTARKLVKELIKVFRDAVKNEEYTVEFSFMCNDRNFVRVVSIIRNVLRKKNIPIKNLEQYFSPLTLMPYNIAESLEEYLKIYHSEPFRELKGGVFLRVDPIYFTKDDLVTLLDYLLKYERPLMLSLDYTYCPRCRIILDGFHQFCPKCLAMIPMGAHFSRVFSVYEPITYVHSFYRDEYLSRKNI